MVRRRNLSPICKGSIPFVLKVRERLLEIQRNLAVQRIENQAAINNAVPVPNINLEAVVLPVPNINLEAVVLPVPNINLEALVPARVELMPYIQIQGPVDDMNFEEINLAPNIERLANLNANIGVEGSAQIQFEMDRLYAVAFPNHWQMLNQAGAPALITLVRNNITLIPTIAARAAIIQQRSQLAEIRENIQNPVITNSSNIMLIRSVLVGSFFYYIHRRTGFGTTIPALGLGIPGTPPVNSEVPPRTASPEEAAFLDLFARIF